MAISFIADPFPANAELAALWADVWRLDDDRDFAAILARSLVHVAAYDHRKLVGFVNVTTDGGVHAFLVDTSVHSAYREQGIGRRLVRIATDLARQRGAKWLHVDYEPHLAHFYSQCGFRATSAGLIDLSASYAG